MQGGGGDPRQGCVPHLCQR
ncbi:hypothetical protein E2C01_042852 [Portunus trituberculatus]|uniref:Uncharacterized protein n=1 Tax=Portunus trituberculatus TaxID=210409 RepID=A0A5B7FRB6_PORTR|nr:hypothetical protein [Portunus trituberculatus]